MNTNNDQRNELEDAYALAMYSVNHGYEAAKQMAEEKKLNFEKATLLKNIELFFGSEVAATRRILWDEERQEKVNEGIRSLMKEQAAKLRARHVLSKFVVTIKRTAQDLLNSVNPAQWQPPGLVLNGANRGSASDAMRGEIDKFPEIEPSLDLEGDLLYIGLVLASEGFSLPTSKDAIQLFVDGEQFTDFEFERGHDKAIDIAVRVSNEYAARASDKGVTLRFNPDLKEIAVIVGEDFEGLR